MQNINTRRSLSLFSGAGGLDVGVAQAGFNIVACIEQDPHACTTLRHNIEESGAKTQVIESDIRTVDPLQLLHDHGLEPGDIDLLFGGPPCQAFSQIGKRLSLDDERGMLLFQMTRFAAAIRPKAILIEQVKGLLRTHDQEGRFGGVFGRLLSELETLGYNVSWKVVNAAEYGVPQKRERVFIVALRNVGPFQFPPPTHGSPSNTLSLFSLPPYRTVGDVIEGLPAPLEKNGHIPEDSHVDVTPAGDRARIHGVPEGSHLAASFHLPPEQRQKLTKKDTTKFRRLSRQEPSLTLRCGEIFYHPTEDRYLTPREYLRIHGYPDEYILKGPVRGRSGQVKNLDQHRQVANSVPPPVAAALATSILQVLNGANF